MSNNVPSIETVANAILSDWVLGNEPLQGDDWDEWCTLAGVDPDDFATMCQQARDRYPRFKRCGHYNNQENSYPVRNRYGTTSACLRCYREHRRAAA